MTRENTQLYHVDTLIFTDFNFNSHIVVFFYFPNQQNTLTSLNAPGFLGWTPPDASFIHRANEADVKIREQRQKQILKIC